ncbi:tyrosine-type recombinase/integrase [Treponema primitia]|uniref:tyrosine-type recombinase/integrase n=1 Tax=Treponema primitia TaxID=88058 RepID=UPI00397F2767
MRFWDFHSFRHLFATRMAERMEGDKVAKVTGHRSKAAAKIYQEPHRPNAASLFRNGAQRL